MVREKETTLVEGKEHVHLMMRCNRKEKGSAMASERERFGKGERKNTPIRCTTT
jgi:hypothetical protein